jgi:hypothetical protein
VNEEAMGQWGAFAPEEKKIIFIFYHIDYSYVFRSASYHPQGIKSKQKDMKIN